MKTRLIAPLFAVTLPVVAAAQETAPAPGTIVVEAETLEEPAEVRAVVQELAQQHGRDAPTTRYFDELCISVSGLNRAGNEFARARILENAEMVGLTVQDPGCRVNALVLVYHDPAELVDRIKDEQPWAISAENENKLERALARGDQILVWHNEEVRDESGRRIPHSQDVAGGSRGVHETIGVAARVNHGGWPRRNALQHSRGVVSATIILDSDVVAGLDIVRLADYATMRLMAPDLVPLDERGSPASVTSPFPDESGPQGLTRFDAAYLEALYSLPPNAPALRMAGAVARIYEGDE